MKKNTMYIYPLTCYSTTQINAKIGHATTPHAAPCSKTLHKTTLHTTGGVGSSLYYEPLPSSRVLPSLHIHSCTPAVYYVCLRGGILHRIQE